MLFQIAKLEKKILIGKKIFLNYLNHFPHPLQPPGIHHIVKNFEKSFKKIWRMGWKVRIFAPANTKKDAH